MSDTYDITIHGHVIEPDGTPVLCPHCAATRELTIYGPVGGAGRLMCPDGHHFDPPPSMDPVIALAQAAAHPDTEML
ncbi:hypothetical protein [Streptomyces sp. NPDC051577]|uniref:hypothetical protein n=1 Tax=Streptomyces sp. NPDC051577 TaxID=3155166 RepID=UPI0034223D4F